MSNITNVGKIEFTQVEAEAFVRNLYEIDKLMAISNMLHEKFQDSVSDEEMNKLDVQINKLRKDINGLVEQNSEFTRWAFNRFIDRNREMLLREFPNLRLD